MKIGLKTVTLTVDPQKFLARYPDTFQNIRRIAKDAARDGLDLRVEFITFPTVYIPLSAMPTAKAVRS